MLQAVSDVAVHIGRFRNVDLFHQGLYHLQCRIFQNHDREEVNSIPHLLSTRDRDGQDSPTSLPNGISASEMYPAAAIENQAAFRTRTFAIQYSEEEIEVNDICVFRVEQDMLSTVPVILELKLMRAVVAPGKDQPSLPKTEEAEFHNISTLKVRLNGTATGMHGYSSVIFDELHFCEIGLMVHACLVDFRLRRRPDQALLTARGDASNKGHPAPLEQSLLDMAYEVSILDPIERQSASSSQGGDDQSSPLAAALDRIQRSYIRKLSDSRKELVSFLEEIHASEPRENLKRSLNNLAPFVHPNDRKLSSGALSHAPSKRIDRAELDAALAARLLVEDFFFASVQVAEVWQLLLNSLPTYMDAYSSVLRKAWVESSSQQWQSYIIREVCPESELLVPSDREIWRTHARVAETRRSKNSKAKRTHCIEDLSLPMECSEHPIIFEQRYSTIDINSEEYKGVHLIVLAHGLQGNPFDMRLIKNNIALLYPKALFLCSSINEYHTEHDIEWLGKRLAREVIDHIRDWCPCPEANHRSNAQEKDGADIVADDEDLSLGRLSFVTYSIGGLIVRSALPELADFRKYMHTFMSLSSMHLGFLAGKYSLTKTLLWLGKKWREGKVYEQLLLQDAPQLEDAFIARLAYKPGLEYFKHVALVGSYQDLYAPFESARVEMSGGVEKEECSQLWMKLCTEIMRNVKPESLVRFDVNFYIPETNLDTMIGRAAHIQFIECQPIMRMFIHTYGYLFE